MQCVYLSVRLFSAPFCPTFVPKPQATLERVRRERASSAGNRADIIIEQTADALDQTQSATQRDLAVSLLNRETTMYRRVERALQRIEDGTYGVCISCDEPISAKRLQAVAGGGVFLPFQERRGAGQQRPRAGQDGTHATPRVRPARRGQ